MPSTAHRRWGWAQLILVPPGGEVSCQEARCRETGPSRGAPSPRLPLERQVARTVSTQRCWEEPRSWGRQWCVPSAGGCLGGGRISAAQGAGRGPGTPTSWLCCSQSRRSSSRFRKLNLSISCLETESRRPLRSRPLMMRYQTGLPSLSWPQKPLGSYSLTTWMHERAGLGAGGGLDGEPGSGAGRAPGAHL